MFENILDLRNRVEVARSEERISKKKAAMMFDTEFLNKLYAGTFESLAMIHKYIFDEIYDFTGEVRKVNISKGNFRFVP